MNPIGSLNAYLAANPAEQAWVEEVLIRGGPGAGPGWGLNKGAHFVLCYTMTGPLGREVKRTPPLPAALVTDDALAATPLAAVIDVALVQQQQSIDAQAAELAARGVTIAQQSAQLQAAAAAAAESSAALAARAATIAELEAARAAAVARVAELEAAAAAAQPTPAPQT